METTRRRFLEFTGGAMGLALASQTRAQFDTVIQRTPHATKAFAHGIASGDPLSDRVILWTRLNPPLTSVPSFKVRWEIAHTPEFSDRIAEGETLASADRDFTVKVDVGGLQPATTYYYRFLSDFGPSPSGRTRTLPDSGSDELRIAFVSCANYGAGYFNVYRRLAQRDDLHFILHLGDYIYEYGDGEFGDRRPLDPPYETITLDDYRRRYACYRSDPDLQWAHRMHPFIPVWDDHETANNSWEDGAANHNPSEGEGLWQERRQAGIRAYSEWLPIRPNPDRGDPLYRQFEIGNLADIIMLDTRLEGRDRSQWMARRHFPPRDMLGEEQSSWLLNRLSYSQNRGAIWRILGQQVMFSPLNAIGLPNAFGGGLKLSGDQWDGYQQARMRILRFIENRGIQNLTVLTGDIHSSWVMELALDPNNRLYYDPETGAGSLGVELVTPAISSPGLPEAASPLSRVVYNQNPHIKYVEFSRRGYVLLDLNPQELQARWYHMARVDQPSDEETLACAFRVRAGSHHLEPILDD